MHLGSKHVSWYGQATWENSPLEVNMVAMKASSQRGGEWM